MAELTDAELADLERAWLKLRAARVERVLLAAELRDARELLEFQRGWLWSQHGMNAGAAWDQTVTGKAYEAIDAFLRRTER